MRWILLVLAIACGPVRAQDIPTDAPAFTKLAAERVSKELPEYNVAPAGNLTLEGKLADGQSTGTLSLDRLFAFCARNAIRCSLALDEYSKGIAQAVHERNKPIDRSMVRLAIRPSSYVEQLRQQLGAGGGVFYSRAVAPGLAAIAVLDFSRSLRFLNDKDLAKLGLSEAQLFELGDANLRATVKPLADVTPTPPANAFGTITGEDYAASRILLHDDWKTLNDQLHGSLVVLSPESDVLLYADGSADKNIEALRTFGAQTGRQASRPLPLVVLRWTVDGWEPVR